MPKKKLKIYFACSIMGEPGGQDEKSMVVHTLKNLGHDVLSEIFTTDRPNLAGNQELTTDQIYHRDMNWLYVADVMVADVGRISLGVGFEMGWMLGKEKRVIALCKLDRYANLTNMIKGCRQPGFSLHTRETPQEVEKILKKELNLLHA